MSILAEARKILEAAGYMTIPGKMDGLFYFEDSSLLGFVWEAPSISSLLNDWLRKQDDFLKDRDRSLRRAHEKSWNVYSVLLSEDEANQEQLSKLARIEEDFNGTRKIARSGLRATSQITRALLPLLPIQNWLSLGNVDTMNRLRARLGSVDTKIVEAILEEMATENAINLILDADEDK